MVSFGNLQFGYEYRMTGTPNNLHVLSSDDSESDLGILYKKKQQLKFDEHIDRTVTKGNKLMSLIMRKFTLIYGQILVFDIL